MQTANIFQSLRQSVAADRTQTSPCVIPRPTALPHDMLGFVTGGKGDRPAPTTSPSLPKGTW